MNQQVYLNDLTQVHGRNIRLDSLSGVTVLERQKKKSFRYFSIDRQWRCVNEVPQCDILTHPPNLRAPLVARKTEL